MAMMAWKELEGGCVSSDVGFLEVRVCASCTEGVSSSVVGAGTTEGDRR